MWGGDTRRYGYVIEEVPRADYKGQKDSKLVGHKESSDPRGEERKVVKIEELTPLLTPSAQ